MGWRTEDGLLNEIRAVAHLSREELATVSRFGIHDDDVERDRYDGRIISGRMVRNPEGHRLLVVARWETEAGETMARLYDPSRPYFTTIEPLSGLTLLNVMP
jgi:hypothetical protein